MRAPGCLALAFALLLLLPCRAALAEIVPGSACSVAGQVAQSGGVETSGARYLMRCNGTAWQQEIMFSSSTDYTGIRTTAPAAPLHVNGEAIIGATTGIACGSTIAGGLRWSSAASTFEMCDGSSWKLLVATGGTGTVSSPPAGTGYFVITNGTYDV